MKRWLLGLLILFGVPLVGLATAVGIEADLGARYAESVLVLNNPAWFHTILAEICVRPSYRVAAPFKCELLDELAFLKAGSITVAGVSLGLVVLIWILGAVAGRHRQALVIGFRLGLYLVLIALAFCILGQVAIIIIAAVELERVYLGFFSGAVIGSVGVGGLAAAWRMLAAGLAIQTPPVTTPVAVLVPGKAQARLWGLVRDVAQRAGARVPDHVLLGLGMDFYATAVQVRPVDSDDVLSGETLHLSLPLMRVLSAEDLSGIIAHELGHFRGGDAAFTLRFLPIYLGVTRALEALNVEEGRGKLAALPAMLLLNLFLSRFAVSASRIGREREIRADGIGASVCGGENMARALLRATAFSLLWDGTQQSKVDAIDRGTPLDNLSAAFRVRAAAWAGNLDRPALIAALSTARLSHPTDTHPSFSDRLRALGQSAEARVEWLDLPDKPASDLIDGLDMIETDLTAHLAQLYIDHGLAKPPCEAAPGPADSPQPLRTV